MTTMAPSHRVAGLAHAGDAGSASQRIPWSTVLPLAVVSAFGSGFWLVVVRGAVGAIQRTQAPFATWLQESTLLLPVYVFAVLLALILARRWFGAGTYRLRVVATTLLLVAVAVTLAASVVQAVNAVYDVRLQATHVDLMASHELTCGARCVAQRQHSGLILQVQALGLGSLVMLVSNLVLLGFAVGLRGGRLDLASSRPVSPSPGGRLARLDHHDLLLLATLLGAATVHATVIGRQLTQWPVAGIALLVLTIAEVDAALLFLLRLRSTHYLVAAVVSAAPLLLWLYAHTAGLPFGPHAGVGQPDGLTDTTTALLETVALLVAVAALRRRRRPRANAAEHLTRVALTGVVAVTVIGAAVGLGAMGSAPQPAQHHALRTGGPAST